jgi:hypothetical protein
MSDTEFKPTSPGGQFTPPSSLALSHPSAFVRTPAALAARAQDTVFAGRRVLLSHHTGGAAEFQIVNITPTLLISPDFTTWRTLVETMTTTTPGTVLVARVVSVPSGAKVFDDGGVTSVAIGGEARLLFTWHKDGATATATAGLQLAPPSDQDDGAEQPAQGAAWSQLHHAHVGVIRPPGAANLPATAAVWSEDNTVKIELQVRGAARLVTVIVSEAPLDHTAEHDDLAVSVNGVGVDLAWETKRPQTSATDGATFEEPRYGIDRALAAAARQTERLGPAIARWGSYTGDGTDPTDDEPAPKVITVSGGTTGASPTMERVSAGANVLWDRESPGFSIIGVGQQPDARRQSGTGAATYATIQVRLRVHLRFAGIGFGAALFRLQTAAGSWLQIRPVQTTIGTTWTWLTITGSVEASIASDDAISGAPYAVIQDFASRGTATANMEIRYWDLTYGRQAAYLGQ